MLRRSALSCAVLALCLVSARGEESEPLPYPLWHALGTRMIAVKARSLGGADKAVLTISNATSHTLALDVNGALVVPVKVSKTPASTPRLVTHDAGLWANPRTRERERASDDFEQSQPLGVGLIAGLGGRTTIEVAPGTTRVVEVLTVCLNEGVPAPDCNTPLALAREPSPEKARVILRAWRDDPKKPQDTIQKAVWTKAEPLFAFEEAAAPDVKAAAPVTRERRAEETALPEDTLAVLVVKGEIAVLTSRGDVLVGPARSPLRAIASDARGVAADSGVLHVLFARSPLSGRPAVARYDVEKKKFLGELGAVGSRLLWARTDAAVVERDGDLLLVDRDSERRLASAAGARLVEAGRVTVVLAPSDSEDETRVLKLERVGRRVDVKRSIVPARLTSAAAVGERVWVSDEDGRLHQLRADGLRAVRPGEVLGEEWKDARIRRVIAAKAGLLVEVEDGFVLQRSGSAALHVGADPLATFLRDPVSGDLYGHVGRSLRRWDDGRAGWIDVRIE